jgi:hypothetical protein
MCDGVSRGANQGWDARRIELRLRDKRHGVLRNA